VRQSDADDSIIKMINPFNLENKLAKEEALKFVFKDDKFEID
jgi:hypothetical protein